MDVSIIFIMFGSLMNTLNIIIVQITFLIK